MNHHQNDQNLQIHWGDRPFPLVLILPQLEKNGLGKIKGKVEVLPETLSAGNQTFLFEMARGDWILTLALISGFGERVKGIDGRVIDEYTLNFLFKPTHIVNFWP